MSAAPALARRTFETSRAAEYFDAAELQAQTGQPASRSRAARASLRRHWYAGDSGS